jgi:dienelactone hydrolase
VEKFLTEEIFTETDQIFSEPKRHESEQILKDGKKTYQINLFSGTTHGFGVRGDIKDPVVKFAKEQAFIQAVQWFDEHLKA